MTDNDEEFGYGLSVDDFDKSLLPPHARTPGTDAFREAVSQHIQKDFEGFGGTVQIVVDQKMIRVIWQSDPSQCEPLDVLVEKLKRGEYEDAVRGLQALRRVQPDNVPVLYNLGMALSDMGRLEDAEECLRRMVDLAPDEVNGLVALGVALARKTQYAKAVALLRRAVIADPQNPWAHRNLGACLMQEGEQAEAVEHLERAADLNPSDQQTLLGLAQAHHAAGRLSEADKLYLRVNDVDPRTPFAEMARDARRQFAEDSFRSKGVAGARPDAVMYLLGALQKFDSIPREQMQRIVFEIAALGQRGFDTNDPAQKYELRTLPGRYSGLHMVCMMYVGFKLIAPQHDIGFDLAKEYQVAKSMQTSEGEGNT